MNKDKTLIIYAGHEINENLLFFCRNGYIDNDKYDFVFVLNNSNLKLEFSCNKSNIKIVTRENIGIDFGAWIHVLFSMDTDKYLYEKYDYFILLNSTVRGPFLPYYYDQQKQGYWPELFISKLDNDVKLVGAAVAFYLKAPFISSAFLVMDKIGLNIGIEKGIFDLKTIDMNKKDTIVKKEIGLSKAIIEAGYNLKSILMYYKDINLKNYKHLRIAECHLKPKGYYGIDVNPYEIIFIKQNRNIDQLVMDRYTDWNINKKHNNIKKICCGISENNSDDITENIKEYISKNKYIIKSGMNLNLYLKSNLKEENKKLFIYTDGYVKIIDLECSSTKSNIIFI